MTAEQPNPFPPVWADAWGNDEKSPFPFVEIELSEGVSMRLRWIPPGRFLMGSPADELGRDDDEEHQHWVRLSSGLWLAETPCTQEQWLALMVENPSYFKDDPRCPVEQVSWDECQAFCNKLCERFPSLLARLPSEAEWEYACRAGTTSAFNDGSACTKLQGKDPALDSLGWYVENSGARTHPVGEKEPNACGLYDMHGNVYEWCMERHGDYAAGEQQKSQGAREGRFRVFRGGGWFNVARFCRSACRGRSEQGFRRGSFGFRLAAVHSIEANNQASEPKGASKE